MLDVITISLVVTIFGYVEWLYLDFWTAVIAGCCVFNLYEQPFSGSVPPTFYAIAFLYMIWLYVDPMASIGALLVVALDHYCLNALLPVWKNNEENPCIERHFDRALSDIVALIGTTTPEEQEPILEASIMRESLRALNRLNKIREAVMKENFGEQVFAHDQDDNNASRPMPIMCLRQRLRWGIRDQAKLDSLKNEINIILSKLEEVVHIKGEIERFVSYSDSVPSTCQA